MKKKFALAILLSTVLSQNAQAAEMSPPFLAIMQAAINAGTPVTETFGPRYLWVQKITAPLKSKGNIILTAQVLKRLSEEGCAMVALNFKATDVPYSDGKGMVKLLDAFTIKTGVCLSGDEPIELQKNPAHQKLIESIKNGKPIISLEVTK